MDSPLEATVALFHLHVTRLYLRNLGWRRCFIERVNELFDRVRRALGFANNSAIGGILGISGDVEVFRLANSPGSKETHINNCCVAFGCLRRVIPVVNALHLTFDRVLNLQVLVGHV